MQSVLAGCFLVAKSYLTNQIRNLQFGKGLIFDVLNCCLDCRGEKNLCVAQIGNQKYKKKNLDLSCLSKPCLKCLKTNLKSLVFCVQTDSN